MSDPTNDRKPNRREDDLTAIKVRKLGQQKEVANEFNQILTCQGGLNDQAHQTCKSLEYAIAISTRPGKIEYYRPPEEATRIVENGDLVTLTKKIARMQREIDQVEQDIQQAGAVSSSAAQPPDPSFSSLAEWFSTYGEPNPPATSGVLTNFEDSPKIYGGTNHHRAFKTQATVMRKGRITR